jgi:hypothetical protein
LDVGQRRSPSYFDFKTYWKKPTCQTEEIKDNIKMDVKDMDCEVLRLMAQYIV